MKNGEGYSVPVEQEAIGNLKREKNRYVNQVFESIQRFLSLVGFELIEIHIRDRKSRNRYVWKERK